MSHLLSSDPLWEVAEYDIFISIPLTAKDEVIYKAQNVSNKETTVIKETELEMMELNSKSKAVKNSFFANPVNRALRSAYRAHKKSVRN